MLDALVALAVPPRCAACRAPGGPAAEVLCGDCRQALPWLPRPSCPRCALPLPCGRRCPAHDAPFDAAWAAVAYEGVARDAMQALKFSAARPLADVMAMQIAANAPPGLLGAAAPPRPSAAASPGLLGAAAPPRPSVIVPVPAHPSRRRSRGFDPAELIARALARRSGLPLARVLHRSGAASRQVGASRTQRREAGRLGIRVKAREGAPARVLLVDDVHTTGATLIACAHALRDAGSQHIAALTWARTLDAHHRSAELRP
jgi:predicted amidophosphoribosyltransferase